MTEVLERPAGIDLLVFGIGSLASMSLGLKMNHIFAPRKNTNLVVTTTLLGVTRLSGEGR